MIIFTDEKIKGAKMKKVIIDCDNTMGFKGRPMDDALAILYLLGSDQDVEVLGICCDYGNGTAAESYESNINMLKETGYTKIPVLHGSERGCASISESSHFISGIANELNGELVYLGLGSLGNLYGAYRLDNGIFDKISQIVLMGGITEPLFIHNGQPLDELNFSVNAEAAACVLTLGHNVTVITGNNCLPVSELPKDEFLNRLCKSDNPAGMYIAQKCGYRFRVKEIVYGADSSNAWDVVAAAYINHPEKFNDRLTPCNITEEKIADSGFLDPVTAGNENCILNIPVPRQRVELQELYYSSWLSLKMNTSEANFSCKGLYLDKLIQPAILISLFSEPSHGFLLLHKLKASGLVEQSLDTAGFYRMLKRMEKDEYIESRIDDTSGKVRKVYSITDFGKQALQSWSNALDNYSRHIARLVSEIDNLK